MLFRLTKRHEMKARDVVVILLVTLSAMFAGRASVGAEAATLTAVTPLSAEHVQFAYDTDDDAQSDLFVIYAVVWQGWSHESDGSLQQRADREHLGIIAVDAAGRVECMATRPVTDTCAGWRYIYVVHHNPVRACHRWGCPDVDDNLPSRP